MMIFGKERSRCHCRTGLIKFYQWLHVLYSCWMKDDIPIQQDKSDRLSKIMRIDRSASARREDICILITISTEREQCRCHHRISH